jgi:ATP-dependent Clp protease protease subunit
MKSEMTIFEKRARAVILKRQLLFDGKINDETTDFLIKNISRLNQENSKDILLQINSGGGHVPHGLAIHDVLKFSQAPIIGLVTGRCCSMATTILQGCIIRLALENSWFLLHGINHHLSFDLKENSDLDEIKKTIDSSAAELKIYQQNINNIFLDRSKELNKDKLIKIMQKDKEMTAVEALKIGLIDEIIY